MNVIRSSLLQAIAVAGFAVALFCIMDATMKGLSLAIGAYNAMLWRQIMGTAISGPAYAISGAPKPSKELIKLSIIRGTLGAVMAFSFFWGLKHVPLAEGTALSFIAPLIALYLAAVILKERIGGSAILASLLGLAGVGVILIAQMGAGMADGQALWGVCAILLSAVLYGYNLILQRQLALEGSPLQNVFFLNLFSVVALGLASPWVGEVPALEHLPKLGFAAFLAFAALAMMAWAYARAEAQILVNLEYTAFVWAAILGGLLFGEALTLQTIFGAALIVAGCLIVARSKPAEE